MLRFVQQARNESAVERNIGGWLVLELSVFGVGFTNNQGAYFFICGWLQPLCAGGCSNFGLGWQKDIL